MTEQPVPGDRAAAPSGGWRVATTQPVAGATGLPAAPRSAVAGLPCGDAAAEAVREESVAGNGAGAVVSRALVSWCVAPVSGVCGGVGALRERAVGLGVGTAVSCAVVAGARHLRSSLPWSAARVARLGVAP